MFSKGLSEPVRKRVELAVAVAQEKLLSVHVDHALDLIALVNEEVSFMDALDIYARLLRLEEDHAQNISTRALAILGEKAEAFDWTPPEPAAGNNGHGDDQDQRSFFGGLRQRFRGRVNEELRRRIEFVAARTEVALMETHVKNALHFIDLLDSGMREREAVELYLDALDVRESVAEAVYYLSLARIADQVIPPHGAGLASVRQGVEPES